MREALYFRNISFSAFSQFSLAKFKIQNTAKSGLTSGGTALHAMQTRSSDKKAVCQSVCPSVEEGFDPDCPPVERFSDPLAATAIGCACLRCVRPQVYVYKPVSF